MMVMMAMLMMLMLMMGQRGSNADDGDEDECADDLSVDCLEVVVESVAVRAITHFPCVVHIDWACVGRCPYREFIVELGEERQPREGNSEEGSDKLTQDNHQQEDKVCKQLASRDPHSQRDCWIKVAAGDVPEDHDARKQSQRHGELLTARNKDAIEEEGRPKHLINDNGNLVVAAFINLHDFNS